MNLKAYADGRDGVTSVPTFVSESRELRGTEVILDNLACAFDNTERSR